LLNACPSKFTTPPLAPFSPSPPAPASQKVSDYPFQPLFISSAFLLAASKYQPILASLLFNPALALSPLFD